MNLRTASYQKNSPRFLYLTVTMSLFPLPDPRLWIFLWGTDCSSFQNPCYIHTASKTLVDPFCYCRASAPSKILDSLQKYTKRRHRPTCLIQCYGYLWRRYCVLYYPSPLYLISLPPGRTAAPVGLEDSKPDSLL